MTEEFIIDGVAHRLIEDDEIVEPNDLWYYKDSRNTIYIWNKKDFFYLNNRKCKELRNTFKSREFITKRLPIRLFDKFDFLKDF